MDFLSFGRQILILIVCLYTTIQTEAHILVKRNAIQMCSLVNIHTGRSCLNYNPYGCFCGFGQQGSTPIDDSDRCCKEHDDCYGEASSHCTSWFGMFIGYAYSCTGNACQCHDAQKCPRKVCECDTQLARCLGQATNFNIDNKHYDRRQCR